MVARCAGAHLRTTSRRWNFITTCPENLQRATASNPSEEEGDPASIEPEDAREAEFRNDLTDLKLAILVILNLSGMAYLNCVSTSDQAIVSILVKWKTRSRFFSVQGTNRHRHGILHAPRTIGYNTRRRCNGKPNNMARISN